MMENTEDLLILINNTSNELIAMDSIVDVDSLYFVISLTIIYSVILATGFIGNMATGIVIVFNKFMHTATNFYLFSLALSDFILLLCGLPLEMYLMWHPANYPLNESQCIFLGLFSETAANATVLTITAFAVERYVAICRPFLSHTQANSSSRTVRYIIAIWIVAACAAAPEALQFELVENEGNIRACTIKGEGWYQVFVISSVFFFIVPMTLLAVLYTLIINKLRISRAFRPSVDSFEGKAKQRYNSNSAQKRIVKMLILVTVCFFVCWAPFHAQRLMAMFSKNTQHTKRYVKVYMVFTWISGVLYYISTVINPIFYSLMSLKFRRAFNETFKCCGNNGNVRRVYTAIEPRRKSREVRSDQHRPRLFRRTTQLTMITSDINNSTTNTIKNQESIENEDMDLQCMNCFKNNKTDQDIKAQKLTMGQLEAYGVKIDAKLPEPVNEEEAELEPVIAAQRRCRRNGLYPKFLGECGGGCGK